MTFWIYVVGRNADNLFKDSGKSREGINAPDAKPLEKINIKYKSIALYFPEITLMINVIIQAPAKATKRELKSTFNGEMFKSFMETMLTT